MIKSDTMKAIKNSVLSFLQKCLSDFLNFHKLLKWSAEKEAMPQPKAGLMTKAILKAIVDCFLAVGAGVILKNEAWVCKSI